MAESRHRHRLCIPRRPEWGERTTPEQLDAQERASFLDWRRDLADLESEEHLVLTPFEKNLQVWRQLWRVVERSDAVVQVVDARDPLTYRSQDLESYCLEIHPAKRSIIVLNKADLLPVLLRSAWADYLDGLGLRYAFWSAKAAVQAAEEGLEAPAEDCNDPRARLLGVDELHDRLLQEAQEAVADSEGLGVPRASRGERLVVGLVGYPNVGKSSTINALFGSKKTAVAATPGKTKHFQTLNVSDTLCLCDCPGLVMPQFAHSKAEMVAAGVIPIDRLTDVRAPVGTVAERVSRNQLEQVYGLRLPPVGAGEDPERPPTAAELLRALALARGWIGASGLPDETRAGRRILKDYVDGRILACKPPPGASDEIQALVEAIAGRKVARERLPIAAAPPRAATAAEKASASSAGSFEEDSSEREEECEHEGAEAQPLPAGPNTSEVIVLDDADLDLLDSLNIGGQKAKPVRAAHKFHKKPPKTKGRAAAGQARGGETFDGNSMAFGKRGGVVRVPVT